MKKYKVTQEFMDGLGAWSERLDNGGIELNSWSFYEGVDLVEQWRSEPNSKKERYKRFGALLNWINGEEVFEIGTPSYVVGLKDAIRLYGKGYIRIASNGCVNLTYYIEEATRFDNFEEASEWANKHFEVVEVDK